MNPDQFLQGFIVAQDALAGTITVQPTIDGTVLGWREYHALRNVVVMPLEDYNNILGHLREVVAELKQAKEEKA